MAFSYKDYLESEKVKKHKTDLDSHQQNKVADWTGGTYGAAVNDAMNKILNREKFNYDLNADMLYNQYKDQYVNLGKAAMKDTMGQASALTGGYGNSYAATAGNQAYQGYLQQLNNVVPELYQMALNRYNAEGDALNTQYGILADRYSTEYGEHRDSVADWQTQLNYLTDMYNNERNFDYTQYADGKNYAYQGYRDSIADEQWQKTFDEGVRQFNEQMANKSSGGGGGGNYSDTDESNVYTSQEEYMLYLDKLKKVSNESQANSIIADLMAKGRISYDTGKSLFDSWDRYWKARVMEN